MSIKPTVIRLTKNYPDDSGVEYEVAFDADAIAAEVTITHHGNTASFELDQIEWLMDALRYIKYQVAP